MARDFFVTTGIVVTASILSSLVTATMLAPSEGSETVEPRVVVPADGELAALLARVERALAGEALVRVPARPARLEVEQHAPSDDEVEVEISADAARVERLLQRILSRLDRRGVVVAGSMPEGLALNTPIIVAAVSEMIALDATGARDAVRDALQLMTAGEAIERFGAPTRAEAANSDAYDMYWSFDEPHDGALMLFFSNGYVLHADVDQN
ncbi:MAG: hypothetical protein GY711_28050 [bacterium]|nr:hypothetical protein [bacterium]